MKSRGVVISVISSASFAAFSYLASLAAPLNGVQVWGWRTLLTVPGILLLLAVSGRWFWFSGELKRVLARPAKLLAYAFTAPMLALQMWLFGWAPQNGQALALSLGYFLMPLMMVLVGRVIFKEPILRTTLVATAIASVAVLHEVIRSGGVGIPTLIVALGYPAYFVIRRILQTDGVGALAWEMTLALPIAAWFALGNGGASLAFRSPSAVALLFMLGFVSIIGVVTYVVAAKELSYILFGLLSYLEPILVTLVAVAIGERISASQWPTFIGIWLAVFVLVLGGLGAMIRQQKIVFPSVRPWSRRRPRRFPGERSSWDRFPKSPRCQQ